MAKEELKDDVVSNGGVNKVVFGDKTLIDLTADTVKVEDVAKGIKFHLPSGDIGTGTSTKDSDTSDATAAASEILLEKTAYVKGEKITGTMPNNGGVSGLIKTKDEKYSIPAGYHDGSGKVEIDYDEQDKIIAENIKKGVTILGVEGTVQPGDKMNPVVAKVTPFTTAAKQQPTDYGPDYNCFGSVEVEAIFYEEVDNAQGGKTVTIGKVKPDARYQ